MKFLTYIKYFYFLFINWDARIAWYMIKQEIKGEKKYGINTTGADELHKLEKLGIDISHATIYMPVSYTLLEEIFEQLPVTIRNHFLDIGSGKGRALCVAAHQGFKQVTGLDFSKSLCNAATENLTKTKEQVSSFSFKVINNDAFYFEIPDDVDCIFFFNPFDEIIMKRVTKNIQHSYNKKPRTLHIIYLNPLYKKEFTEIGFKEIFYTCRMKYMEAVILKKAGANS